MLFTFMSIYTKPFVVCFLLRKVSDSELLGPRWVKKVCFFVLCVSSSICAISVLS